MVPTYMVRALDMVDDPLLILERQKMEEGCKVEFMNKTLLKQLGVEEVMHGEINSNTFMINIDDDSTATLSGYIILPDKHGTGM